VGPRDGVWPLLAVTLTAWVAVVVVTQLLISPALEAMPSIGIGVVLTTVLTLGYPSVLRGPGARRFAGPRTQIPGRVVHTAEPLRAGLTAEAAHKTVRLLKPILGADAVALTDDAEVLAYAGRGAEQHGRGTPLRTAATRQALARGTTVVVTDPSQLVVDGTPSPFRAAVIAPLRVQDAVVGTLKAYRTSGDPPLPALVEALAGVLSLQLELAEVDRERELAANARLDALRAQINPHFLFNTLNTIASKTRTDPDATRQLLLRLSDFFRYATQQQGQFAEFGQEYFFVRTYLTLEQARYGDRLGIRYDIDPQVLTAQVPVLVIQPLVENAVKHGLAPKVEGGTVSLRATADPLSRTTTVTVTDDGIGMSPEVVDALFTPSASLPATGQSTGRGGGIALVNIAARLSQLFGDRHSLRVTSALGEGTEVQLRMPLT
jgi:LytS/YehU family sensor histidine kinase